VSALQELLSGGEQQPQPLHLDRSLDRREDGRSDEQEEQVERREEYQTHVALFQRHLSTTVSRTGGNLAAGEGHPRCRRIGGQVAAVAATVLSCRSS